MVASAQTTAGVIADTHDEGRATPRASEARDQAAVTPDELAAAMRARADTYRLLSSVLLHELTDGQIARLRDVDASGLARGPVADGFAAIHRYLRRAGADPRTDLAVDYARVFLSAGVYDGMTAEPYESAFTSEDHLLYQEARDQVMRIYRENGFAVDPSLHMPEDHLGVELEFLARMASRTADAVDGAPGADGDADPDAQAARLAAVQAEFIERHVLNWVDDLTDKVDEFAELPLYPAFMRIVRGYASEDRDLMGQLAAALAE